jgi:predicted nucleotidyltransferase
LQWPRQQSLRSASYDPTETRQLVARLRREIGPILAPRPALLAYLYGSYAAGKPYPFSDLDIALVSDGLLPTWQEVELQVAVATELETRCPDLPEVDIRVINLAPLTFQGQVLYYGILLYSRDEIRRVEFETSLRSAYFDYQPAEEMIRQAFLQHVKERGLRG